MKRAPEVRMTERTYRRKKRRQLNRVLDELDRLAENSEHLPNGASRRIKGVKKTLDKTRASLIDWWSDY
jgi:hypothetical protein